MNILIVEDNTFYQKIFTTTLKSLNINYKLVDQVAYAQELLDIETFDIIYLDINLPDNKGWILLDTLDLGLQSKVVLMTGYESASMRNRKYDHSYHELIPKPFGQSELLISLGYEPNALSRPSLISANLQSKIYTELAQFCSQNDPDFSMKLLQMFKLELTNKIPGLKSNYEQGRFDQVTNSTHQLKSNSRYFGFTNFANICEDIEKNVHKKNPEEVSLLIEKLVDSASELFLIVNTYIDTFKAETIEEAA